MKLLRQITNILFLITSFAPSISHDSKSSPAATVVRPPPPLLPAVLETRGDLSASGRKLQSLNDNDVKYDTFLFASPDGTIYLTDRSMVHRWEFFTGFPFLQSKQAHPDLDYFIEFGANGQLYEYSKTFGRRELNLTIEELVREAAILQDFNLISGSKETTIHFLNETNGEVIYRHRLLTSGSKVGVPLYEKLIGPKPEVPNGYIMLVRTDYSLSSIALPTDPTEISTDTTEPLWQCSLSHISAVYVQKGQSQINIPVYLLSTSSIARRDNNEDVMLPPASHPLYLEYHRQDPLMLPSASGSINIFHSLSRNNIKELPSDKYMPFDLSNYDEVAANSLMPYSTADEPQMISQESGENFPHDITTGISLDLHKDSNSHIVRNDFIFYRAISWIAIPFWLFIIIMRFLKSRLAVKTDDQNNLKSKHSITPKKKKTRKTGNTKTSATVSSESEKNESNDYWIQSVKSKASLLNAGEGRWVGKLFVSNLEIGRGSNGTVVLEGVYDGRPVAVKRLLRAHHDVAYKEIENLIASDRHPNIVRWYGVEQDIDFVYISLERCSCSLSDLIQFCSDSSLQPTNSENQRSVIGSGYPVYYEGIKKDLELWSADGFPSPLLLKLMRDVVAGLAHLHELGIIHRDMKPQNVLINTDKHLIAKLSDMGISKRLVEDMSSISHHATGYGSAGWQAPERLLHGRQTRAVDLFSLGCILFFCITKGRHPFGTHFERDSNIVNNRIDLFLVDHIPEAVDLLLQLLDPDPNLRLSASEVLHHPIFWNPDTRLAFLRDASDRVELEDRESESELLKALENVAPVAFGGKWGEKLDAAFITDIGRFRKYKFDSLRDLLRVIRNKLNHYRELPKELKDILGPVPDGFDRYFSNRFPKLMIEVYKVMHGRCCNEDSFKKYFIGNII